MFWEINGFPYINALLKNTPPFPLSYVQKIRVCPVTLLAPETAALFRKRMENIAEILADTTHHFHKDMLHCALLMLMMEIANEHIRQENECRSKAETNRAHVLVHQFIHLMPHHIQEGHTVGWYASRLCVTPQYLNRVVKDSSQKTVYQHICTTLTGAVMQQPEQSEQTVAEIAEAFHFPDQSTLTKFFKRQTGKTPTDYRKAHLNK